MPSCSQCVAFKIYYHMYFQPYMNDEDRLMTAQFQALSTEDKRKALDLLLQYHEYHDTPDRRFSKAKLSETPVLDARPAELVPLDVTNEGRGMFNDPGDPRRFIFRVQNSFIDYDGCSGSKESIAGEYYRFQRQIHVTRGLEGLLSYASDLFRRCVLHPNVVSFMVGKCSLDVRELLYRGISQRYIHKYRDHDPLLSTFVVVNIFSCKDDISLSSDNDDAKKRGQIAEMNALHIERALHDYSRDPSFVAKRSSVSTDSRGALSKKHSTKLFMVYLVMKIVRPE